MNGAPGVYSARYASEDVSRQANVLKLLTEMNDISNRKAKFKTVIAFVTSEYKITFEGCVDGKILNEQKGTEVLGMILCFNQMVLSVHLLN